MIYTNKEIEILKKIQSGMTLEATAQSIGTKRRYAYQSIKRFRKRNNLINEKHFVDFLKNVVIPDRLPTKKYTGVYQDKSGAWCARISHKNSWRRVGVFINKESAFRRRQEALVNPEKFIRPLVTRSLPKYVYNFRGKYMVKVIAANNEQIYIATVANIEQAIEITTLWANGITAIELRKRYGNPKKKYGTDTQRVGQPNS